jgi:perosamine synthetase
MSVLVDEESYGEDRNALMGRLESAGIESRPFFCPIPLLAAYGTSSGGDFATSSRLYAEGVSIPSSASLTTADQERVIAVLRRN